ncbi:MAG: iron-containing alcohol dehydrogenase [Pirellulaceae bacterium]|nr:iron-containing alcohol dehydrogenase [Pirellulaceae bacterium]
MHSIDFQHPTRLVFGQGSVARLGEFATELCATRVLLVSDAGVVAAGHHERAVQLLKAAGLHVQSFLDVHENPSTVDVQAGAEFARQVQPDLLIGLGGGSSMDCAKGINFLYSCGGTMEDYWGVGKATGPLLPMVAVPTTAGTGSEAQSFALISQHATGRKMACGDRRAACRIAVLDPELTVTQPPRVTALTGIDAISHALESYVCKRRNPLSTCYSRQAWQLLSHGFPIVLQHPSDLEARGQVQLGAFFAGLAIETSMLGAAHALANPLTAQFGVTHGQAVGMMLPQVIRFNGTEVAGWYDDLWHDASRTELGRKCNRDLASLKGPAGSVECLAELVGRLVRLAGLETELQRLGVAEDSLDALARDATDQWTGAFNPRSLTEADFREIYLQTMARREAS